MPVVQRFLMINVVGILNHSFCLMLLVKFEQLLGKNYLIEIFPDFLMIFKPLITHEFGHGSQNSCNDGNPGHRYIGKHDISRSKKFCCCCCYSANWNRIYCWSCCGRSSLVSVNRVCLRAISLWHLQKLSGIKLAPILKIFGSARIHT
jgi:hypothetical protein